MESDTPDKAPFGHLENDTLHELRRGYHDRIAGLRTMAQSIVAEAADRTATATAYLLEDEELAVADVTEVRSGVLARVAEVESEVLSLLALEAPVARDLRVILSSRDIAHLGELCVGLAVMLATNAGRARAELTSEMRAMVSEIGDQTVDLLRHADGAWATLDSEQAESVLPAASESRKLLRSFFTQMMGLTAVPIEAAVALGRTVRGYERLTDHAVEIADRVLFACNGAPPGLSLAGFDS